MKYIIEIKPEYEANGIMILGARDSHLYVTTLEVKDLEELNSDYINEHYGDLQDTAYQRGLAEGKKATFGLVADALNADYQRGFEDGKAVSDKGCEGCQWEDRRNCEICETCCNKYQNQWQAKQTDDEIKVGDEVYCKGDDTSDSGVVTWVGNKRVCAMWQDGSAGEVEKDELIKTNRHFDIASILKEMQS